MATGHWTNRGNMRVACLDGLLWAEEHGTFREAWAACPRADWMVWWLVSHKCPDQSRIRRSLSGRGISVNAPGCSADELRWWYPNGRMPKRKA